MGYWRSADRRPKLARCRDGPARAPASLISMAFKFWLSHSDWILIACICELQTIKDEGSLDSLKKADAGLVEDVIWWTDWDCNALAVIP